MDKIRDKPQLNVHIPHMKEWDELYIIIVYLILTEHTKMWQLRTS